MDYIKREDALDAVLFALVGTGHQSEAICAIKDVPTADVVEVVRCKDCTRGFGKFIRHEKVVECQLYHHDDKRQYKDPMDYCSHGVRREHGT